MARTRTSFVDSNRTNLVSPMRNQNDSQGCIAFPLSARRSPQTVLQPGNLYGFPTAGGGSSQGRLVIEPTRVMLGRSRITRALPLAREAIPQESDFILDVNTSVWPGCNFPHFVVNRVSS